MLGKFLQLLLAIAPLALAETFFIPMRDGTKLHTDIDFPPFFPAGKRAPVVFERSPYGENKEELIALVMAELLSYIGVRQDVRGTGQSEGRFGVWHDSVNDSYDTLDWISNQTWSNGQVFVTGVSADAIDAVCTMSAPHPSVRAQVIIFATSQAWETFYVGGAYREALIDGWLTSTVRSQAPALIPMVHSHEALSDPWWDTVNGTLWFNNVAWPSIHWAGWYDIFQSGHLAAFRGYNELSALPGQAKLVIDPCGHCQAAAAYFPENAVLGRAALPLLMALDLLADDSVTNRSWPAPAEGVKNVTFYVMGDDEGGAPGNYWTTLERFPEPTPYTLYFHLGGTLEAAAPSAPSDAVAYSYNPADPVPTVGGDNLEIPCGPLDQRVIERAGRQDVLIFTSDVLTEPLAITGGPLADIFMSSTALDTDMTVKLIDVYPARDSDPLFDGASILVLDGILRMKWRNWRTDNAEALLSGNPADVYHTTVGLWNTSYVFGAGHRVRVHVSSSNYPRFYPNPNTGKSFDTANVTARNTLHLSAGQPSSITLPRVALSDLPRFPVEEAVAALARKREGAWGALGAASRGGAGSVEDWLQRKMQAALAPHVRSAGGRRQ